MAKILIGLLCISIGICIGIGSTMFSYAKALENPAQKAEDKQNKVLVKPEIEEPSYICDMFELDDEMLPDYLEGFSEFNQDAAMIAQTLYGECRGLNDYEQSLVVWCILNRVDSGRFGDTIKDVITAPNQFYGYSTDNPVDDHEYDLAVDILMRWNYEKYMVGNCGRTLPKEYVYFYGKGGHNKFRVNYNDLSGSYDFTDILPNPYK